MTSFAPLLEAAPRRHVCGFRRGEPARKRFKRVALRYEKTAENYAAIVAFACGLILVKSVHTTCRCERAAAC